MSGNTGRSWVGRGAGSGRIGGERSGSRWIFHAADPGGMRPTSAAEASPSCHFKVLAGQVLAAHYSIVLAPASLPRVRKRFDFVSPDRQVVGDGHYFTNVHSVVLPRAKCSTIFEAVWLLEKTGAATPFVVWESP
jgi:hypothetical protein